MKWIRKLFHKHEYIELHRYLSWTGEDVITEQCKCGAHQVEYTLDTYFGRAKAPSYIEFFNKQVKTCE